MMNIENTLNEYLHDLCDLAESDKETPVTHYIDECRGAIVMAIRLGLDYDTAESIYEPYRLHLHSLKGEEADCLPEEYDLAGLESISISEIEQYDMHLETWGDDGDWHGTLFGNDICTEHFTGKTENEVLDKAEAAVNRILEQWREWDEDLDDVDEVIEWLRAEAEDHEFEAARERRYGYDD